VAGYTITIAPNDDETGPLTTIRVDTGSGSARITELTVRAVEGAGLSPQQLPAVNLEQLIAALAPSAPAAIAARPHPEPAASPDGATPEAPAEPAAAPEASASPIRAGRSARGKKAGRKAPAKKAPSRVRQAGGEKAGGQTATGRRAYRRMPEAGEVLAAYREVGGTTALARHFGVPRHTATGWLRRLRSQGMLDS